MNETHGKNYSGISSSINSVNSLIQVHVCTILDEKKDIEQKKRGLWLVLLPFQAFMLIVWGDVDII